MEYAKWKYEDSLQESQPPFTNPEVSALSTLLEYYVEDHLLTGTSDVTTKKERYDTNLLFQEEEKTHEYILFL